MDEKELYSLSRNKPLRVQRYKDNYWMGLQDNPPIENVDIVFLAGGTCRIPSIQTKIKQLFPNARMIIDGELEIITATGAALHALQVLNGEVEPYVSYNKDRTSD